MAIGALRALRESGLKVPEDVAIVSFNGIEASEFANPPLTTIKVHTEEMGRTGVKLLLDRLKGRELPLKVTVPSEPDYSGKLRIQQTEPNGRIRRFPRR